MPTFEPFCGLRYSLSHVKSTDDVVCPPYDVISEAERLELEGRSPVNVVRLELPRSDRGDPYEAAALLLDAWRDGGVLHRDPEPAFYGYRMTFTDDAGRPRSTLGVVGALALEAPGTGILPHEETTPKAKSDRLALLRATRTNTSPIWALSPSAGLSAAIAAPAHPAEHALDAEGVRHELWPITDPVSLARIAELVAAAPVLLADGHHRYETALAYQAEAGGAPGAAAVMALVVELAEEQLTVAAIHRLLSGLPPELDLVAALGKHFELTPTDAPDATIGARMLDAGALALHTTSGTWLARPLPATTAGAVHDLDSSRLDVALGDLPDHHVTYQHGWDLCTGAVDAGHAQATVLLRPATIEQIAAVGRGGRRMPPKTTFFWPKPRTGMVLRELAG